MEKKNMGENIGRLNQIDDETIEIYLSDIKSFLKKSKLTVALMTLICALFGIGYSLLLPNEYSSQIMVMPELQPKSNSTLSNLGSLAGLAGINLESLSNGTDAIRPDLYPTVVQSVPFSLHLLTQTVYKENVKVSLESFLSSAKGNPVSVIFSRIFAGDDQNILVSKVHNNGILQLTKEKEIHIQEIQKRVGLIYDKKSGIITVGATMQDPVVAADVAQHTLAYLTAYITGYRTEKARAEVDFLLKQVQSAKKRYEVAELNLSAYRDRNRGLYTNVAKIEEQRLQAEYLLAQDLYNNLSKQLEMARIKIQENTPVFKILEPAKIPLHKSGPNRTLIVMGMVLLGCILGLLLSFIKSYMLSKKKTL
ncbi:Wzz/FepE/Etk N-terminal domain-containing protein [Arsenicibacter rosenii]|uniref:Lipopolysaccharide biosynthesis protein n=1 Tax=Arsenicibacter rosenii TaxID=1750698 RepID=A0A1S2VCT5_9BACT|nr:Wzz/FepE/Etk N-terminal domain-containing protein [Arsenicibacter rosenii]OIN56513.1 hypothetical protein BLX24_24670 [Arsenicibacter rosenii]